MLVIANVFLLFALQVLAETPVSSAVAISDASMNCSAAMVPITVGILVMRWDVSEHLFDDNYYNENKDELCVGVF